MGNCSRIRRNVTKKRQRIDEEQRNQSQSPSYCQWNRGLRRLIAQEAVIYWYVKKKIWTIFIHRWFTYITLNFNHLFQSWKSFYNFSIYYPSRVYLSEIIWFEDEFYIYITIYDKRKNDSYMKKCLKRPSLLPLFDEKIWLHN